jgi:hypothetical protein
MTNTQLLSVVTALTIYAAGYADVEAKVAQAAADVPHVATEATLAAAKASNMAASGDVIPFELAYKIIKFSRGF